MVIGALIKSKKSSTDNNVYLKMAVISPDYHNKGIGHYCINQIIEMLKQRNYLKLILYTNQENHKAKACYHGPLSMYKKVGFELCSQIEGCVVCRKKL